LFGGAVDSDEGQLQRHHPRRIRNSSADEIANVNFLRRLRTRTTAHNKVYFPYGKHTCPQLPNETLTIIDSRIGLNSATGSSQDMSQCYCK